jgi:hypothetical protein
MDILMACGHTAISTHSNPHDGLEANHPSCVIHAGLHWGACKVAQPPELIGRFAKCSCGKTQPSSLTLAFFEYLGPESPSATENCAQCGYLQIAHRRKQSGEVKNQHICLRFKPHGPYENDRFYCGCRGWD